MLKKIFSVVIVILILTTMVPISTLAADSDNDYLRGCSISFENEKFWSSEWGEYVDEVEKIIDTTIDLEMPNYFTQCELTPHPSDRDNASYKIYSSGTLVSNNTPYTVDMPSPETLAFRVEVTAQNGQTRDYTVNITRAAADNEGEAFNITLSGDTNSEGSYDIEFLSNRYQYDINVDNKQTVANFYVYPMDELTTYNIYCNDQMISTNESTIADLLVGTNKIEVVLASQTSKQKTYTFLIHRDDSDSLLDLDGLSAYSYMTPFYSDESSRHNHLEPFDKHNVNQSFIVPNSIQSITYGVYPSSDATVVVKKGEYTVSYVEGLGYQSSLDAGVNTFTFEVSHPDMSFTKTYAVTVTREAQNNINADLGNLRIFGSPVVGFDSNTITYDYYNSDSSSLTVTPIVKDSSATYQVFKDGALVGSNSEANVSLNASPLPTVITVVVTAGNGTTTKTYTVNVKRVSSIAVLKTLTLNNNSSQNDYPVTIQNGIYTYSVDTAHIDDTVYMSADFNRFKENSELVVYDSADQVLWDSSLGGDLWKTDLALNVGLNTYRLEVTAEDGVTKNNYAININRAAVPEADNADINNVTLWLDGREVDFFTPNDYDYEFSVDNKIYSIELHYTLKNSNATSSVYLNGNLVAYYAAGAPGVGLNNLPLNEGANTLSVEVVAQDGVTTNTYSFNINRAVSALQYIDIVKMPDKVEYVIGDTLDLTGLSVRSNYESGYFEMLDKEDVTASGYDSQTTGSQTITITYQSKTTLFDVNVTNGGATQPVTGVSLDKSITSVAVGGTDTLTATVSPTDATNKNMTWSSDDVNVATVTDGVVTGVAAGTATITVETVDGEFTDTCLVNVSEVTGFVQGNGTPGDPYGISTPAQLNEVRNYLDSHFILLNDIDLDAATSEGGDYYNDGAGWMPIGDSLKPFEGVFDGDGYEITGLNIDLTTTVSEIYIGLFGYVQGTIKNINVDTGSINVSTTGEAYVGTIAGYAVNGNILNCIIDDVNLDVLGDYVCTGGITGYAENTTLEDCGFKGNITANASGYKSRVGGIVGLGLNGVRILTSYNTGSVFAEGRGAFVGGIAGFIKRTDSISIQYISKCYNTGDICANCTDTTARIAGIAGYASYTEITNSFNTGQISKQSTYIATLGGIVGYTSYSTISSPISLYDCYNVGEIIGGGYVGAIAGGSAAGIDDCYYADTCSVGIGSGTGTTYQKTLEQMKQQATYNGFNFSSIWEVSNHVYYEYPTLQGVSTYPLKGDTVMFDGGFGTETKPFLVSTPEHLNNVRYYPDAHFIMLNDIDMSAATSEGGAYWNDGAGWEPIQSFSGTFNGAGYQVSGLQIYRPEQDNVGLFASTDSTDSIIQNVRMMNYTITGNYYTGSVVGYNIGKIENCCSEGVLNGYMYVGGIAGYNSNDILECTNSGEISGYKAIGGICGKLDGLSSSVSEATNTGDITGEVNAVGGIVGYNTNGLVKLSYNTGQSAADYYVGGIVGNSSGTIDRCYNAGRVEGDNNPGCSGGGIAGRTSGGVVSNCFNVGETNIYDGYGTIVGYVWGETHIRYCYNANYKRAYATGYNERGTITSYYFFYEGDEYSGTDAKTRQELCQQATFENYDFADVWEIIEGERFPVLKEVPFTYADSISLPESLLLNVNECQTLTAIASPSEATNHMVIWSLSDTGIASIGIDGKVSAYSPGEVTMIATSIDGGLTDTCILTVMQPVAGVTLNESIISLDVDNTTTLTATISPENATNKNVTWSSDNESVATVSNGIVTAVSAGTATISVTTSDGEYTDTCTVTVTQPVTGISLDESTITLGPGNTYTITETVEPANASNKNVTWGSDNESIATVSDGVLTGVSPGTATITVTTEDGSFTDTCVVTVTQPVTGVSLEWSTLTVYAQTESMPLISTVYPANASNKNLSWSSSNNSVATVVGGLVNPLSSGTATITVTTEDGGFTDTCVVTVKERKIESNVYSIDSTYISGIAVNTSVTQLKSNLLTESRHIKIFDTKGVEYTGSTIATGMKVKFYLEGDIADELTIIILGDANGDGKISITDYTLARLDILGLKDLEQTAATAADINDDGKVSITDYTLMRLDILGLKSIH